ncbi:AAA family ATPase [Acidaminobacter sp. JC074]|uniref:sigma-54 interaction domain-containing protein n=1 Tax=Acidaminobacter sp. JC074 TaxID=2530199 RepID=UPI001F0E6BBC|nr:sigma 54-interacting transcriptional regulator [Acidaminobacter sp. JC074]MCH4887481.1 AAA family ATPase [Acidaminobacter sp. JC074]
MNKLLVVSKAEGIGKYYCDELRKFFDDAIVIDYIAMNYENVNVVEDYDLILITTHTIVEHIMQYVRKDSRILKVIKTLDPEGIRKIDSIPYGSEALVVNVGPKTVSESIYLIYALGRSDLELHPYYPGIEKYKDLDYVITQGELSILPETTGTIVDIKNTMLDSKTLLEIISYFKLDKKKFLGKLMARGRMRDSTNDGMSLVINERFMFEEIINVMFENLNEGVLIYDSTGLVTSNSRSTESFLHKSSYNILGKKITDLIPVKDRVVFGDTLTEMVIRINNVPLICNIMPELTLGSVDYGLVILKKYNDEEVKMHRFRKALIERGHTTKYSIHDIVGSSEEMTKIKDIALRMSGSDSTVLIIGESGTGKELFAHVIHNNSKRSHEQFVAVNCSAIPENLLESELFGYEEGAFTGAKKGGKTGLFEIANGGTLFLDEIGEIPLHLQSRLLRVLQEKEIMRVGSNEIVSIDVRIIAATNIDMKKQVELGRFRKDLYYRLSVLPLHIPPLRKRGRDVLEIFNKMNKDQGSQLYFDDQAENFMTTYYWDGNVRELSNCFEYLLNLGKNKIELSDLPERMKHTEDIKPITQSTPMAILNIVYTNNAENKRVGRKSISDQLAYLNIYMGEQEVRQILLDLQSKGYVSIGKGRGGTRITKEGIDHLMTSKLY